ncbi:hypothetical protein BZA77DRAFT_390881, partial [Pyronema omphalodes]
MIMFDRRLALSGTQYDYTGGQHHSIQRFIGESAREGPTPWAGHQFFGSSDANSQIEYNNEDPLASCPTASEILTTQYRDYWTYHHTVPLNLSPIGVVNGESVHGYQGGGYEGGGYEGGGYEGGGYEGGGYEGGGYEGGGYEGGGYEGGGYEGGGYEGGGYEGGGYEGGGYEGEGYEGGGYEGGGYEGGGNDSGECGGGTTSDTNSVEYS